MVRREEQPWQSRLHGAARHPLDRPPRRGPGVVVRVGGVRGRVHRRPPVPARLRGTAGHRHRRHHRQRVARPRIRHRTVRGRPPRRARRRAAVGRRHDAHRRRVAATRRRRRTRRRGARHPADRRGPEPDPGASWNDVSRVRPARCRDLVAWRSAVSPQRPDDVRRLVRAASAQRVARPRGCLRATRWRSCGRKRIAASRSVDLPLSVGRTA